MPDYSMCLDHQCGKRFQCYRYMAEPSELYQSYSDFKGSEDGCAYFFPITHAPTKLRDAPNENNCIGFGNDG